VATDVASDLTASGGVADMDCFFQVEFFDKVGEIIGVGIQIIAMPGLLRPAMTSAVVSDATVAALGQKEHLVLEGVG
jgi:hypothetical protein